MSNQRLEHLKAFYSILEQHEKIIGGARTLANCSGRLTWPNRGVYFFRESGENRADTGPGPRVVRVGTHALKAGSATKLWTRLSQHKGQSGRGGGKGKMGHAHIRLAAASEDVMTGALQAAWKLRVENNAKTSGKTRATTSGRKDNHR
jgi:hypothetical protein